jgi:hypothetical protein
VRLNLSQRTDDGYVGRCNCRGSIVSHEKGPRAEGYASRLLDGFPPVPTDTLSSPTEPEVCMMYAARTEKDEAHEEEQRGKWEQQNTGTLRWDLKAVPQNNCYASN